VKENHTAIIDCSGSQLYPKSKLGPLKFAAGSKIQFQDCQLLGYSVEDFSVANSTQQVQDSIVQDGSSGCTVRLPPARRVALTEPRHGRLHLWSALCPVSNTFALSLSLIRERLHRVHRMMQMQTIHALSYLGYGDLYV
jgi:hypothetical protein